MRLDVPSARTMCLFNLYWRSMAGLLQPRGGARRLRLHWRREKISPEELLAAHRFERVAAGGVDGEPRGRTPWRATSISSNGSRSASLGLGLAAQALPSC